MKTYLIIYILFIAIILFSNCTFSSDISKLSDEEDNNTSYFENYVSRSNVNWVFMVYLDGDNNLESALIQDFNEMEYGLYKLKKNYPSEYEQIRIVVFFDRISGYYSGDDNWTNTRFYEVSPDDDLTTINSDLIASYKDMNMGDKSTLTFFMNKVITYYEANNYFLVIGDHGDGVRSSIPSENQTSVSIGLSRGAVSDDTDGGYLYLAQISEALSDVDGDYFNANKLGGIGFDCCLMGMAEVNYEFRDYSEYFVGSMANESSSGWDYTRIFEDLQASTISAKDFSIKIVDEYRNLHELQTHYSNQTLSAVNLSKMEALKSALDDFAVALYEEDDKSGIETIRDASINFYQSDYQSISNPYYDLYDFCDNIINGGFSDRLISKADSVITALDNAIVKAYAGSSYGGYWNTGARGLSIFISRGNLIYDTSTHYAYQWWYTSIDTLSCYGSNYKYGNIDFCNTGSNNSTVETWKELFEAWYDPLNIYVQGDYY